MKYVNVDEKAFERLDLLPGWESISVNDFRRIFRNQTKEYEIKGCYMQAFEQLSENEFLMVSGLESGLKEIQRIICNKENKGWYNSYSQKTIYQKEFRKCYQLPNDVILFDKNFLSPYHGESRYSAYSVKENKESEDFKWLSKGYNIRVLKSKEDEKDIVLYVTKTLKSEQGNDYIQFLVDSKTFNPISEVYSTLRGETPICVKSKDDVKRIVSEDSQYKQIVDSYFVEINNLNREKDKQKLLSR